MSNDLQDLVDAIEEAIYQIALHRGADLFYTTFKHCSEEEWERELFLSILRGVEIDLNRLELLKTGQIAPCFL